MTVPRPAAARSTLDATLPFALPIGISAFLLFSVEPLIGRLVLPAFGGAPAVWATILFFFQAILLLGYLYGHLSVTRLGRVGPPVHLAVATVGLVALLIAPASAAGLRNEATAPAIDLLGILIRFLGLPAFVLTATTPLLSGWFHASARQERGDPYWLYALSNAGSLLALLAYPLVIEPRLGLAQQRGVWAIGYVILVVLIAWAAVRLMSNVRANPRGFHVAPDLPVGSSPTELIGTLEALVDWPRRTRWLLLAAVPSGLLAAVTNFIARDLVSAPLLWVIPLAIYLGSFIVAFSPRADRVIGLAVAALPAMVTLLWIPYASTSPWPILTVLVLELVAFAVVAVALHGTLARDRPDPSHLTEFYLVLSTGGALAGFFVAVVAPSIFPDIWEYPLLLVGALGVMAWVGFDERRSSERVGEGRTPRRLVDGIGRRLLPYAFGSAFLVAMLRAGDYGLLEPGVWIAIGAILLGVGGRAWVLVGGSAVVLTVASLAPAFTTDFRARSFFGVTEVNRGPDLVVLMNGTILHGAQFTAPERRRTPTTYYAKTGPAGDIFAVGADSSAVHPSEVGIVGLGAGTLAAYKDEWMTMTYFEIDPVVIRVAQDPGYFTYLSDAPGAPEIVEGDARLSLLDVADGEFDLLVLDAFSSDSIPIHLVTAEAIAEELRTVTEDGVLAFHISNRYYDLRAPIAAALRDLGVATMHRGTEAGPGADDEAALATSWLAASRSPERLAALRARGWEDVAPADRPFTDDYADLLSYLRLVP